jgi:hypothetical protein
VVLPTIFAIIAYTLDIVGVIIVAILLTITTPCSAILT